MSELIPLDDLQAAQQRVIEVLTEGRLAVVPAESGYALIADAFNSSATRKVFAVKRHSRMAPLTALIRSPRQVGGLASEIPEPAERLMATYWPGPLTLVFRAQEGLTWYLGESAGTVALRMPADDLLLAVIAEVGPIAATLASGQGRPLPRTAEEAREQLRRAVAVYVEGGARTGEPSTIVDVTRGFAEVLRRGAIPGDHIEQVATGALGWGEQPSDEGASRLGDPPPEVVESPGADADDGDGSDESAQEPDDPPRAAEQ